MKERRDVGRDGRPAEDGTPSATHQGRRGLLLLAVVVVAVLIALAYWRSGSNESDAPLPVAERTAGTVKFLMEQQWRIRMMLAKVEPRVVSRQVRTTGRLIPAARNQAVVAPSVGGVITGNTLPRLGQRVIRGQTIAQLQQTPTAAEALQIAALNAQLRIETARFEAERRSLTEKVSAAKAEMDEAEHDFRRTQRLYARQAVSQQRVEQDERRFKVAVAGYNAVVKQLDVLSAAEQHNVVGPVPTASAYTVNAPISGTIVRVNKVPGEQVAPGEAIVEIVNLETVWVEAPVFERDLHQLTSGMQAVFTTMAFPGREFRGSIVDISPVIDVEKRTSNVIFAVSNSDNSLRIGMQAEVRLDTEEAIDALVIPASAVLEHEGKKIVYVLLSGEEFERREVTVGDEAGGGVAVLAGLKAGERVVTQGALQMKLQELNPGEGPTHSHET